MTFEMSYKRSALFMIKKKYLDLDFTDIDLTQMEGYNIHDPVDGSESIEDLNIDEVNSGTVVDQSREEKTRMGKENVENVDYNPLSSSTESEVSLQVNEENVIHVLSD